MDQDLIEFFDRSPAGVLRIGLLGRFRMLVDNAGDITAVVASDDPGAPVERVTVLGEREELEGVRDLLHSRTSVLIRVSHVDGVYIANASDITQTPPEHD